MSQFSPECRGRVRRFEVPTFAWKRKTKPRVASRSVSPSSSRRGLDPASSSVHKRDPQRLHAGGPVRSATASSSKDVLEPHSLHRRRSRRTLIEDVVSAYEEESRAPAAQMKRSASRDSMRDQSAVHTPRRAHLFEDLHEEAMRKKHRLAHAQQLRLEQEQRELRLEKEKLRSGKVAPDHRDLAGGARGATKLQAEQARAAFLEREASFVREKQLLVQQRLREKELLAREEYERHCTFRPNLEKPPKNKPWSYLEREQTSSVGDHQEQLSVRSMTSSSVKTAAGGLPPFGAFSAASSSTYSHIKHLGSRARSRSSSTRRTNNCFLQDWQQRSSGSFSTTVPFRRETSRQQLLPSREARAQQQLEKLEGDYKDASRHLDGEFDRLKSNIEKEETERVLSFLQSEDGHSYLRDKIQNVLLGQNSQSSDCESTTTGGRSAQLAGSTAEQMHAQQVIVADLVHKSTKRVWGRVTAEMQQKRETLDAQYAQRKAEIEEELAVLSPTSSDGTTNRAARESPGEPTAQVGTTARRPLGASPADDKITEGEHPPERMRASELPQHDLSGDPPPSVLTEVAEPVQDLQPAAPLKSSPVVYYRDPQVDHLQPETYFASSVLLEDGAMRKSSPVFGEDAHPPPFAMEQRDKELITTSHEGPLVHANVSVQEAFHDHGSGNSVTHACSPAAPSQLSRFTHVQPAVSSPLSSGVVTASPAAAKTADSMSSPAAEAAKAGPGVYSGGVHSNFPRQGGAVVYQPHARAGGPSAPGRAQPVAPDSSASYAYYYATTATPFPSSPGFCAMSPWSPAPLAPQARTVWANAQRTAVLPENSNAFFGGRANVSGVMRQQHGSSVGDIAVSSSAPPKEEEAHPPPDRARVDNLVPPSVRDLKAPGSSKSAASPPEPQTIRPEDEGLRLTVASSVSSVAQQRSLAGAPKLATTAPAVQVFRTLPQGAINSTPLIVPNGIAPGLGNYMPRGVVSLAPPAPSAAWNVKAAAVQPNNRVDDSQVPKPPGFVTAESSQRFSYNPVLPGLRAGSATHKLPPSYFQKT
ncbi:unnamed protein product [Amoebophrya sp. A120]|nr:unnamed protein product [Amoebophrya sp. A120]|eukprot:GSA120T00006539001.1